MQRVREREPPAIGTAVRAAVLPRRYVDPRCVGDGEIAPELGLIG